jgi:hypothetical protein
MERSKVNLVFLGSMFLFWGSMGLLHFFPNVTSVTVPSNQKVVDAVGLFFSGMACGASGPGFIMNLRRRIKD